MARRLLPWSDRARGLLAFAAVVAIGLAAEWQQSGFRGQTWVADLFVGVLLGAAGSTIVLIGRWRQEGTLLAFAALMWFAPNFAGSPIAPLGWLAGYLFFMHRAALFHAVVAFPAGRVPRPTERIAVGLVYLTAASVEVWQQEAWTIAWAIGTLAAFVVMVRLRRGAAREAGFRALPAMVVLSLVVGGTAALLWIFGDAPAPTAVVYAYEAGIVAVGFTLAVAVYAHRAQAQGLADAVIELTLGPAGYVRELLAGALRDFERRGGLRDRFRRIHRLGRRARPGDRAAAGDGLTNGRSRSRGWADRGRARVRVRGRRSAGSARLH